MAAAVPAYAAGWVARMLGNRRNAKARVINSPEGSLIVRCSWDHTGFHARGGTATREEVCYLVWKGETWAGGYEYRKQAIAEASS